MVINEKKPKQFCKKSNGFVCSFRGLAAGSRGWAASSHPRLACVSLGNVTATPLPPGSGLALWLV